MDSTVNDSVDSAASIPSGCPMTGRRTQLAGEPDGPMVEYTGGGKWIIRSYEVGRDILRRQHSTRQGSFGAADADFVSVVKLPLLFQEGEQHRKLRLATAQFFTPKKIRTEYAPVIDESCASIVATASDGQVHDVSDLSLELATVVAAQVLGMTESPVKRTARNIERLTEPRGFGGGPVKKALGAADNSLRTAVFYWQDVFPAIRERRRSPQHDLISHLLSQGYKNRDVLTECIMYGGAGVVTTREFICVAVWHFLTNDQACQDYLKSDAKQRLRMLEEILRLEPVVGIVGRIATEDVEITHDGETFKIPAGDHIDIQVRRANADPAAVGADGDCLRFDRELKVRGASYGLSFGEGHHKCPGQHLALQESDALLTRLLALDVELVAEPSVEWNVLINGYEIRGLKIRVR